VLKYLAKAIKLENEIKDLQIGKKEVKLSIFADYIILLESTRNLLDLINTFSKVSGYKMNTENNQ
jgi:hypothetical protein